MRGCVQRMRVLVCGAFLGIVLCGVHFADSSKLPPAPRKLRARAISPHVIKLKWRDPAKRRGRATRFYSVRYNAVGDDDSLFIQSADNRVRVGKLHPNTTYVFSVRTIAGKKGSPWSSKVKVTTAVVEHRIVTKLRATAVSSESIRLTWKLPKQTNETVAYAILWSELDTEQSERTAVVANGSVSFTLDKLTPHRLYSFRVQSMLSEGPGGSTEKVIARPFSDKPGKAPRNVGLKYSNDSYVLVSWRPPAARHRNGVLLGYKVQYKRKGSRRGDVCSIITKPQENQYVLTDIAGGETYKVRVAATTVNGTGPFCKWESVDIPVSNSTDSLDRKYKKKADGNDVRGDGDSTGIVNDIPATPEKLSADDVKSTTVTISWSQPETPECCPIVAYRIMSRNVNMSELTGEMVTGPTPEAKISFLQPDTVYGFNVSAYSIAGESEHSEELIVHTLPAEPPTILSVHGSSAVAGGSVNLTCVVRAEPPPEVTWFGPNKTLPYSSGKVTNLLLHREEGVRVIRLHKSSHDVTSHLLMDRVTVEQGGVYTCVARNSAGTVRSPAVLQVNVAPTVMEFSDMAVTDGQGAELMCTVRGAPLPSIVWLREESDVIYEEEKEESRSSSSTLPYVTSVVEGEGGDVRRSFLHFPRTSLHHQGNYTCLARSLAGTNETNVLLTVNIPPPPAVQNLRAIALSPHSVSVVWDRPFEYNYTIDGYRVSYKPYQGGQTRYLDAQGQKQDIHSLLPREQYLISVTPYTTHQLGDTGRDVLVSTLSNEGLQPANVSAVALNSSMIQLDWASPQNIDRLYIRGYNIYYRRENETQQEMLFIEGNRNKQFLIGLGRDETYYLRIATLTTWGFEAPSQWIRIQKHPHELLPPVTPAEVKAVTTVDSIRVTWTSSNEPKSKKSPLLGYRMIYGPVDAPSEVSRVKMGPTATQFTIRGLNSSTKYIIALRAYNAYAVSEPMYLRATTKALPPSMVLNATAVPLSPSEIHVYWQPPKRGKVTRYQLRYWRPGKRDKQSAWLIAPTTNYVAGSLKAFSQYRFEIIPFSGQVIGEGSVIFADTLTAKPGAPPSDVVMTTINATHMLVTWKLPPASQQNGVITGYKLIMKKRAGPRLAKFTVEAARYNYTFVNLMPNSTYKIRMAAINSNGTGPFTDWIVGRTDKLEMRQPDSPQSMKLNTSSRSVVVTWSAPRDLGVPVMGYIVGYGRYIPEVYRVILGPSERSHVITDLKPETEYIVSVRAFNHIGESVPQFAVVQTVAAPPEIKLEVPVKLRVIPLSPTAMALTWLDPSLIRRTSSSTSSSSSAVQPTDGRVYLIRYSAISGENYQYLNATSTSLNVTELEVATTYEFAVRTTIGGQQSGWSLPVVNTTQQTAPSSAPGNVTVVSSPVSSALSVTWTKPALSNGQIQEYIVYYTSEPSVDTKLWMIKTTKRRSTTILEVMPHTTYYVRVQARNAAGYGPLSAVVVYSPPTDSRAAPTAVKVWSLHGNISTAVEVVWREPALPIGHITGYMVYYSPDSHESSPRWMIQRERGLSALILGLSHNSTYIFKVRARYGASLGPFSELAHFTTPEDESLPELEEVTTEPDDQTEVTTYVHQEENVTTHLQPQDTEDKDAPQPPEGLTVTPGSDHVNITWQPLTHPNTSLPLHPPADSTTHSDDSVSVDKNQPIISEHGPAADDIQPIGDGDDVSVNSSQPISYLLELYGGDVGDELLDANIVTETHHTFSSLEEDTSYMVKVQAVDKNGISAPAVVDFHTLLTSTSPDSPTQNTSSPQPPSLSTTSSPQLVPVSTSNQPT